MCGKEIKKFSDDVGNVIRDPIGETKRAIDNTGKSIDSFVDVFGDALRDTGVLPHAPKAPDLEDFEVSQTGQGAGQGMEAKGSEFELEEDEDEEVARKKRKKRRGRVELQPEVGGISQSFSDVGVKI